MMMMMMMMISTAHPVSGINFLIHAVSLARHVSTHLLIHLSAHLCRHHHSHHPSLLHSFSPGSNYSFEQILPTLSINQIGLFSIAAKSWIRTIK